MSDDFDAPDKIQNNKIIDFTDAISSLGKAEEKIKYGKKRTFVAICICVVTIIFFPWLYDKCIFSIDTIKSINNIKSIELSGSYVLTIYLLGKTLGLLFLISLFAWFAKIYNSLRRLEITYIDKAVNLWNLSILNYDADYKDQTIEILKSIFEPTLQQTEQKKYHNKIEKSNHLIEAIANFIDKITEKLSSK